MITAVALPSEIFKAVIRTSLAGAGVDDAEGLQLRPALTQQRHFPLRQGNGTGVEDLLQGLCLRSLGAGDKLAVPSFHCLHHSIADGRRLRA
ncbi:hypothetical protein [Arthrobacter sp. CJ23]|uniref:hypothetical protein n=1 Tax=Arthrobacter sp. CJ23 TaxID=2972479 RepID=UPI00215C5F49|nr:hypothetical protein [Arthrobacter sp. CJ23]UVJ40261.1 hypothetical protein NVV90_03480 [Arthrobacter sp. CJ23]